MIRRIRLQSLAPRKVGKLGGNGIMNIKGVSRVDGFDAESHLGWAEPCQFAVNQRCVSRCWCIGSTFITGGFNNCLSGPRGASGTIFVRTETVYRALYDAA